MALSRQLYFAISRSDTSAIKQIDDANLLAILGIANNPGIDWSHPLIQIHMNNLSTTHADLNDEAIFEYLLSKMETYLREGKLTIDDALKTRLTELSLSMMYEANAQNWLTDEKIRNFVSRLILLGTNVNSRLSSSGTALHLAIERNYADVVSLLLLKGADPTLPCFFEVPYRFAERLKRTTILAVMKKHALRILNQYALILDPATGTIKFKNESLSAGKAILKYEQALACDPKNSLIYLFRGIVQSWQGNTKAAEEDFAKAKTLGKSGRNQADFHLWDAALNKNLPNVYRDLKDAIQQRDINQIRQIDEEDLILILGGRLDDLKTTTFGHPLYDAHVHYMSRRYSGPESEKIFEYFLARMQTYLSQGKIKIEGRLKEILSRLSVNMMYQSNGRHWLSDERIEQYVCSLIALGADVNENNAGYNALYLAVEKNYGYVVESLLRKSADATITSLCEIYSDTGYLAFQQTPYELAVSQERTSILDVMHKHALDLRDGHVLSFNTYTGLLKCKYYCGFEEGNFHPDYFYRQALACHPKDGLIQLCRGMLLFTEGRIEEAEPHFAAAFELGIDQTYTNDLRLLGMAYYYQNKYKTALGCFKKILEKSATLLDLGMRGLCYHQLGKGDLVFADLYPIFSRKEKPPAIFMPIFCEILLQIPKGFLSDKPQEEIFSICKKFPVNSQKMLLNACLDSETGLGDRWKASFPKEIFQYLKTIDPDYNFPITPRNFACMYGQVVAVGNPMVENLAAKDDGYLEFGF